MRLLKGLYRFFGKIQTDRTEQPEQTEIQEEKQPKQNENCARILELKNCLDTWKMADQYIARKDYSEEIKQYSDVVEFFRTLKNGEVFEDFCRKNQMDTREVDLILTQYETIEDVIRQHNDQFISTKLCEEKEYLDHILQEVDANVVLDEDQRKVVLTDEDYCLVVAGAGAGKTTTVAAKVKYLVEKKQIDPSQILIISFTNKAVNELKDKIQKKLQINCPIATFHSTGNALLHKNTPEETLNIVDNSKLYFILRDYFRGSILKDEVMVNKLILFFASYFDAPYEGDDLNGFFNNIAKANYSTFRSDLEKFQCEVIDRKTKKSITIQNEILRSHQEVEIANFLYLNHIDYEYEPAYPYNIPGSRKTYTPDFLIRQGEKIAYIEHFGITEDGKNDRYSDEELDRYKKSVNDKVMLHKQHGTTLLYTFSQYQDGRELTVHLKEKLQEKGFELVPRSNKEVLELLVAGEENRYIRRLLNLICRFIANFKVNGYEEKEFQRMRNSTPNVRSKLFLDICQACYLEYERWLKDNRAIDFEDMINESARILLEVKEMKQKLDFKYVIVDEYQDISRQRFDLTKAISDVTDAKIMAVGDDWQSIYAFSGSDITLFTKFKETMGYAEMLKIVKTYRNSQEVIDIAGNFIQKNKAQIKKRLISPKHLEDPVIIYTYDNTYKKSGDRWQSGANYSLAKAVETALTHIVETRKKEGREPGSVLLLGRFGFDGDKLEKTGLFEYVRRGNQIKSVRYPQLVITFMTVHSSKGLGYDDVIVVNGKNETYGFPSKIEDDPVLGFVIKGDRSIDYAEERRLFYVAMTRTKNRVYFVAPENNPSEFLLEIKRDYKNVRLEGEWNEAESVKLDRKSCPLCGYPMQLRYKKAYGLRLYICTNEPEVCGFMTNDCCGGKMWIQKCDQCRDGYLIVKNKADRYFLGCTNYKPNGTGCCKIVTQKQFYEQMGYPFSEAERKELEEKPKGKPKEKEAVVEKITQAKARPDVPVEEITGETIKKAEIAGVTSEDRDLNEVIWVILTALQNISAFRYYGVTMLVDVLKGGETERIRKYQLNKIPEYGSLKDMSREQIRTAIDWLITQKMILQTKEKYPVLHPTYEGIHYADSMTKRRLRKLKTDLEGENTQ